LSPLREKKKETARKENKLTERRGEGEVGCR